MNHKYFCPYCGNLLHYQILQSDKFYSCRSSFCAYHPYKKFSMSFDIYSGELIFIIIVINHNNEHYLLSIHYDQDYSAIEKLILEEKSFKPYYLIQHDFIIEMNSSFPINLNNVPAESQKIFDKLLKLQTFL